MAYGKETFTQKQFLKELRLVFSEQNLKLAVASRGKTTRERLMPLWLLSWVLIAWFFQAHWGLPSIVEWFSFLGCPTVPSDAALYAARLQLGCKPMWWLRTHCVGWLSDPIQDPDAYYRGRLLVSVDGSNFTVADTKANDQSFGRAGNQHKPSAFPLMRVVALCELGTHALIHWLGRSYRTSEKRLLKRLVRFMPQDSLLLGDRNFHSYDLWEQAKKGQFRLLLRVQSGPKFPVLERLADGSYLSEVRAKKSKANRDKVAIQVRVIEYEIIQDGKVTKSRIVTSLLEMSDGGARELVELYQKRWEQESTLKEFKSELSERVTHLRGKTPRTVLQELDGLLMGHYVVRRLILKAARKAGVSPIKISFSGTIRILQQRLGGMPTGTKKFEKWFEELLLKIGRKRVRKRRNRSYPRVRKVVRCPWPVKKPEHQQRKLPPLKDRIKIVA